jgi:hypothetical protein
MKVVYKKPITAKINTEITTATLMNKKIDHILVDNDEWEELKDVMEKYVTFTGGTMSPPFFYDGQKTYCKYNGIRIVKENS